MATKTARPQPFTIADLSDAERSSPEPVAESRWFDSPRGRMHYIGEGSGQPILFCHGNPTWSFLYREIIIRLRDRFRCIAADNLGFGLSERPSGYGYTLEDHAQVLGDLVDHLGLDQFVTMVQD